MVNTITILLAFCVAAGIWSSIYRREATDMFLRTQKRVFRQERASCQLHGEASADLRIRERTPITQLLLPRRRIPAKLHPQTSQPWPPSQGKKIHLYLLCL